MPKRDERILEHSELVSLIAKEFQDTGVPIEDIIQEGFIALIEVSDTHNNYLPKEVFDMYAIPSIRYQMKKYVNTQLHGTKKEVQIDQSYFLCRSGTPIRHAR